MNKKHQLFKRMYALSSILVIAAFLLTACNGGFSLQGSAKPNPEGGVDINVGSQPKTTVQPASSTGLDQSTIILIVVGIAFFILLLVLMVTRGQSKNQPPS